MRARALLFTPVILLIAVSVCAQQVDFQDARTLEREVLQVQAVRFQAMIDVDIAKLGSILADDLTYTHTTGQTETKAEFLSTLQSQTLRYESIEPKNVQVRIYGSTAVVTGLSEMRVTAQDQELAFAIRFIEVYGRKDGSWQLVAWQSTRLPQ